MKSVLMLLVLGIGCVVTDLAGNCNMAGFYLEMGCTPVDEPRPKGNDTKPCPKAFNCPVLHPDPSKCYYRGLAYDNKERLPQEVILNACSQACSCRVTDKPRFECASVDCVETFEPDIQQECIQTYELTSCCSIDVVCGKDAIAKLKTCDLDGQTFYEGQAFEPPNSRKTCVCTSEWDACKDDLSSPACTSCRDINCGLEIHYQDMLMGNCAPIFAGDDRGCPIGFQCPSKSTKVVRGLNIKNISEQCTFGNETLSVGDRVKVDEEQMDCLCKIPPFVACTKQFN